MNERYALALIRGSLIAWAMLGAAACGDDDQGLTSAAATGTGAASASGGAGAGSGATGGGGGEGGSATSAEAGATGSGGSSGDGGRGSTSSGDGGSAASAGGGGSGGRSNHGLKCRSPDEPSFPAFSKACEQSSDCVALPHVTSCCGDILYVGVDADDEAAFESAEAKCAAGSPVCDCVPGAPRAEDGKTYDNPSEQAVAAICKEGSCTSEIRYLP